ncbi:UbiD family decarboxylase [Acidobacteria bacterium AH-259-D05]|nr:UbiD family decarboxylase [Acidobacteria bacterium AH-259-D05]
MTISMEKGQEIKDRQKMCSSMREFIEVLESHGKLRRVEKEVDPSWEVSCIARWVYQGHRMEDRFALLFENVKGSTLAVATPVIGASRQVYALALGTTPEQIHEVWLEALRHPLPPQVVDSSPVHEVVIEGEGLDLSYLPVPIWTPGKDRRPTITALVITKDDDTGVQNMGTYRCQIQSKTRVTLNTNPGRQAYQNYQTYATKGKRAPVAVAICCEPAVHIATAAALPKGVDEMTAAGGLKGSPIEMVKARSVDLLVPASAEIVVEGLLDPTGRMEEDGFGEFAGYMGTTGSRPFFDVQCITHRKNAIYYGYISQHPPSESTLIQGQANECVIHKQLVEDWGEPTVLDVALNQTHGGLLGHVVVQMKPLNPGHAKKVGRMVAEMGTFFKIVMVVDPDIDVRHQQHLDMALNSRVNPARDLVIIKDVYSVYDPAAQDNMASKLVIDATAKGPLPDVSLPPRELLYKGYESWKEAGLPDFDIPHWMDRLLAHHAERMKEQAG